MTNQKNIINITLNEFNNKLQSLMLPSSPINADWQILIDQRKSKIESDSSLYLYNEKIKTILLCKVETTTYEKDILINFYILKYPIYEYNEHNKKQITPIENQEQLKQLFKYKSPGYSITYNYSLTNFNFKTDKMKKLFETYPNPSELYMEYRFLKMQGTSAITKLEEEDFQTEFKKFTSENPDFKPTYSLPISDKSQSIYSQEFNVLKNLLNLTTNNEFAIKQIRLRDLTKETISLLGTGLIYMFNKTKEKNILKDNKLIFNDLDDYVYHMSHSNHDFLVTQSQNGGYLIKKNGDSFKGYMFGFECLYKELDDLLETDLNDDLMNIEIDSLGNILYYDSWLGYAGYNIINSTLLLHDENSDFLDEDIFIEIAENYKNELKIIYNKERLENNINKSKPLKKQIQIKKI